MIPKRYQPLEEARAKAFEEARLQREARQSRSGGKYKDLKAEHGRAVPEQKSPDRVEPRDTQSRGIEDQGSRRTASIEEKNNRTQQDNYEKNKTNFERQQREEKATKELNAKSLEHMRINHPIEYAKQMKDNKSKEDWNRQRKEIDTRPTEGDKKIQERGTKSDNKWSKELSEKGRQTSDHARSKGREGQERNGHERNGR